MELISSRENSVIKEARKLKERKHREEKKQFLVEGLRFVAEALGSEFEVASLFLSEDMAVKWGNLGIEDKIKKTPGPSSFLTGFSRRFLSLNIRRE